MIYLVCFCTALILLLIIMAYGKAVDMNVLLLNFALTVGNGGFFAMASSKNLDEALLANKLAYVIGVFVPLFVFLIICNICRVNIPRFLCVALYAVQMIIYLTACTMGKYSIFYSTAEYHTGSSGAYLTKTYGPMHTVYIVSMLLYTLAGIVIGVVSLNRKNVVSRNNVYVLLFADSLSVGVYIVERLVHLNFELMPVALVIASIGFMILIVRIYRYSVYNNQNIIEDKLKQTGYIIFNKKLKFMGCNEYATELFPELAGWELEDKIPGNGGRVNTFLRQPLMSYIKQEDREIKTEGTYEYRGEAYRYQMGTLTTAAGGLRGYVIQLSDVTGVLRDKSDGDI